METDPHHRTIHALPFRKAQKPVSSGRKAWRVPALIAGLAGLLVGGSIWIYVLSLRFSSDNSSAPPTLSEKNREKEQSLPVASHRGGQVSPTTPPGQKGARDAVDAKGDENDSNPRDAHPRQAALRHLTLGRDHEREGRDALAFAAYQEALRLHPGSEEARSAADRVRNKIAVDQFQRHMSAGLTAYHQGDYALAKAEFQKAEAFRPGTPEAEEALTLVDEAFKLKALEAVKEGAAASERVEDWEKALDLYLAALKIDSTLHFALEGKERAVERMALKKRLRFYLEKPDVLESDAYLEKAMQLLDQAQHIEPSGPRHREEVQRLQRLVQEAQTRVPVRLISDNFTEVSVFKIGKLGTFSEHELLLRPGKYTLVGARSGYRDIRKELVVKAGDRDHRITIICTERI